MRNHADMRDPKQALASQRHAVFYRRQGGQQKPKWRTFMVLFRRQKAEIMVIDGAVQRQQ